MPVMSNKRLVILLCILLSHTFLCVADEIDNLVPCIIQVESSGNPNAISEDGCMGLMQVSPIVLKEWNHNNGEYYYSPKCIGNVQYNIGELYEPKTNVKIGTWYLRRLKDHYLKDVTVKKDPFGTSNLNISFTKNGKTMITLIWYADLKYIKSIEDYETALILAAYNGGISRLKKVNYDINKMPKETRDYIRKVMKLYKQKGQIK